MHEVFVLEAHRVRGLAGPSARLSRTRHGIAGCGLGAAEFCRHARAPSLGGSAVEKLRPKRILACTA